MTSSQDEYVLQDRAVASLGIKALAINVMPRSIAGLESRVSICVVYLYSGCKFVA